MKIKFWQNKKILITGIDGFVGSNLSKKLIKLGSNVSGIILKNNKKSLLYYEKINRNCKLYKGDLTNKSFVEKIFKKILK